MLYSLTFDLISPLLFLRSAEPSGSFDLGDAGDFDDGLRRRNVPSFDAPRPRTSDEDEDDEELEFKLAEKKEEKAWLSVNKCIAGALVLLFLGSLFLSGESPGRHLLARSELFHHSYKSATKSLPALNVLQSTKCHNKSSSPQVMLIGQKHSVLVIRNGQCRQEIYY